MIKNIPRTTNCLEAWHRRGNTFMGGQNLGLKNVIEQIKNEQHSTGGTILCLHQGNNEDIGNPDINEMGQKLFNSCKNVENMSNMNFINQILLLFSSKIKRQ